MEALQTTTVRICELAGYADTRRRTLQLLRGRLALAMVCARMDSVFCAHLTKAADGFCDALSAGACKLADLEARLHDAKRRAGPPPVAVAASQLPDALAALSGANLYRALRELQLPAAAPADAHLAAALAAQRCVLHDKLEAFIAVLGSRVGVVPEPAAFRRFGAFLGRQMSLENFVEAHIKLAAAAPAGRPPGN